VGEEQVCGVSQEKKAHSIGGKITLSSEQAGGVEQKRRLQKKKYKERKGSTREKETIHQIKTKCQKKRKLPPRQEKAGGV